MRDTWQDTVRASTHYSFCTALYVQVLFKLDKSGWGEEVLAERLTTARELPLQGFSHDMFMQASTATH